jgi:Ca-activated chloride channel homolog
MTFTAPALLFALALVPLAAASYALAQRSRRRYAVRFTNLDLLENVVTGSPRWRRHLPPLFFLLALTALALSIAQPHVYVHKPREQATVVLATDSSGSMQATDVRPNRLEAARAAAKRFISGLPTRFQLGLVSFNQTSQLLVPPTGNRKLVGAALDGLEAKGGTAIGTAIETSLSALRPLLAKKRGGKDNPRAAPAVVVLLSDGYSTTGLDPTRMANEAHKAHVPINTVALGTDAATVTLTDRLGFSQTVRVPPDRATLRRIANITGGQFFDASDEKKLSKVYKSLGSSIGFRRVKRDVTAAFAGAGLGLMMLGGALSVLWFGRLP